MSAAVTWTAAVRNRCAWIANPWGAGKVRTPSASSAACPSGPAMLGSPDGPAHGPQAMLNPGKPWLRR